MRTWFLAQMTPVVGLMALSMFDGDYYHECWSGGCFDEKCGCRRDYCQNYYYCYCLFDYYDSGFVVKPCSDCDGVESENLVDDRLERLVIDYDC